MVVLKLSTEQYVPTARLLFCGFGPLVCLGLEIGHHGAANGVAALPIVVVGRIDISGAVEVEVVGVGAVRVRGRRPVVAVVTGVGEQVAILPDDAAPKGTYAIALSELERNHFIIYKPWLICLAGLKMFVF